MGRPRVHPENEYGGIPFHEMPKLDDPRRHDPKHPGSAASGVKLSLLTDMSGGDWSWKPHRYPRDPGVVIRAGHVVDRRGSLEAQMPTWRAPDWMRESDEAFNRRMRWAIEAPGKDEFQEAARAAHRVAGDYGRRV